ncbi:MAG: DUF86 domain-containing protein [Arcobacteraceae bacterium]|jgi:uncharacterized protein with HEPN domain|nr:DUF86 domain-containing protein [Arcobacteraceae bacterium]
MLENRLLILSTLDDILMSLKMIQKRFKHISSVDDFLSSEDNIERLDGISMRLLAIGEALKNIDKLTNNSLLIKYPQIEWKNIKGLRDILSHHYFDINADIIFDICDTKIDELVSVIELIVKDLNQ